MTHTPDDLRLLRVIRAWPNLSSVSKGLVEQAAGLTPRPVSPDPGKPWTAPVLQTAEESFE